MANPRVLLIDDDNAQVASELVGQALPALSPTGNDAAVPAVWFFNQVNTDASVLTKVAPFAGVILGAWAIKTDGNGAGGNFATIKVGSNTAAVVELDDVDATQIFGATTLDDSNASFAEGDSITCTATQAGGANCAARVYVLVAKA
ncbi:MAG: hypothetical protein FJ100_16225 [Deltaproteobacteria bacterium]|nr:hypothetical protein [Deltaproteobacteria bacterium]